MRQLAHIAVVALLATTGCTTRDGLPDAGGAARGMVRIDLAYTHEVGAAPGDLRFDAQARFVRYRAFDAASIPTILGFADFDNLPLDGCKVTDGTAELDQALAPDTVAPSAEVALLDAGRLSLIGPADHATLSPHHYPELVPFVSGVVYGGDEATPLSLALGQPYQVIGDGGSEVGPFAVAVTAPSAFPSLSLEPLRRGAELPLRWVTTEGNASEALLLEVKWASRTGTRAVRCRVRDDGDFTIPAEAFASLPPTPALTSALVTATRIARSSMVAPGAGAGELAVALKDVAPLQVAGP